MAVNFCIIYKLIVWDLERNSVAYVSSFVCASKGTVSSITSSVSTVQLSYSAEPTQDSSALISAEPPQDSSALISAEPPQYSSALIAAEPPQDSSALISAEPPRDIQLSYQLSLHGTVQLSYRLSLRSAHKVLWSADKIFPNEVCGNSSQILNQNLAWPNFEGIQSWYFLKLR